MPLETYRGNGGGIFLKMEYDAPKAYLTAEEENLLLNVLDSLSVKEKKLMINLHITYKTVNGKAHPFFLKVEGLISVS